MIGITAEFVESVT